MTEKVRVVLFEDAPIEITVIRRTGEVLAKVSALWQDGKLVFEEPKTDKEPKS